MLWNVILRCAVFAYAVEYLFNDAKMHSFNSGAVLLCLIGLIKELNEQYNSKAGGRIGKAGRQNKYEKSGANK